MCCSSHNFISHIFSFDDGDFDDAEEDEGLDDLENVEDVNASFGSVFNATIRCLAFLADV